MKANPLVSVIIPTYNRAAFLPEAIESILAQTYSNHEVIVVDDGSTDGTAEVVQGNPDVRYDYQPHSGIAAVLNRGVALARGDYLSFLDSDDLWLNDKLEFQLNLFAHDPELDMAFGNAVQFYTDPVTGQEITSEPVEAYLKASLLISPAAFYRVGLFDPQWQLGDFVDWYIRARELGLKEVMPHKVLLKRRVHGDNMGISHVADRNAYLHILKQALDRKHQAR